MNKFPIRSVRTVILIILGLPASQALLAAFGDDHAVPDLDQERVGSAARTEDMAMHQVAGELPGDGGIAGAFCYESQKLTTNPNNLGRAVAVDGDVMAVGGPNGGCSECGSVNVYRNNGMAWVQEQELFDPNQGSYPRGFAYLFGDAVAVSDDVIAIATQFGACPDEELFNCGTVYIYRFNGTTWIEEESLSRPDSLGFGRRVSLSGDVLVVSGVEFALVYRFDGSNWVEEAELTDIEAGQFNFFGWDVAISGDVIIVGAPANHASSSFLDYSGGVQLFRYNGATWTNEYFFQAFYDQGELGFSVAIDGNVAVASRPSFNNCQGPPNHCGALWILEYNGVWQPTGPIYVDAGARSVAVSGDTVVSAWTGGQLRVHRKEGVSWIDQMPLAGSDATFFGALDNPEAVAMSGENAVALGARCTENAGAYVYGLSECNPPTPFTDCDMNGVPDECQPDCNNNGIADVCDITSGFSQDCGGDSIPDECEIANCNGEPFCGDCNTNGIPDGCDIHVFMTSTDSNANGIPDDCEFPFGDLNGSGGVNLDDILCMLTSFAGNQTCAGGIANADLVPCAGNGVINIDDILAILQAFAGADLCP